MPYISKDKRVGKCDEIVQLMKDLNIQIDGELNYIIFKFIRQTTPDKYNALKNAMGELEMCKLELYRRLMAVREEVVMRENGDVM
jgi:hemerythrin superfamily protein